jgi:hypothetical protein
MQQRREGWLTGRFTVSGKEKPTGLHAQGGLATTMPSGHLVPEQFNCNGKLYEPGLSFISVE